MEADGDELYNYFLAEVEYDSDKHGDDDFIDRDFPWKRSLVTIYVMIVHRWEEGDLYSEPPEEHRGGDLKLLS